MSIARRFHRGHWPESFQPFPARQANENSKLFGNCEKCLSSSAGIKSWKEDSCMSNRAFSTHFPCLNILLSNIFLCIENISLWWLLVLFAAAFEKKTFVIWKPFTSKSLCGGFFSKNSVQCVNSSCLSSSPHKLISRRALCKCLSILSDVKSASDSLTLKTTR